ncbi:MAG: sugar-binding domain-containing protein [Prolixibacteraceae bacterium]
MKRLLSLLVLVGFFLSCTNTKNESPNTIPFDDNWKFALDEQAGAEQANFDDQDWRLIRLPHDFSIEHQFDGNNPTLGAGAFAYSGIGWYRKTFHLDENANNKRVTIQFNGVYRNSEVWLNGHHLGLRPYGYSTFTYDLTPYLNKAGTKNTLAVKVNTREQPNSRWYTGAGIYRHVYLHVSDPTHLLENGVFAQTVSISEEKAKVDVAVEFSAKENEDRHLTIECKLTTKDGQTVSIAIKDFDWTSTKDEKVLLSMDVLRPELWSIDEPNLYQLSCELKAENKVLDSYTTQYGIRTVKFDPDKGFFLNGKRVQLKGTNNHHDGGPLGAAYLDYTFERQLRILKDLGSNALRMSHNPPAPELLEWADRLGFVVIDESFDEWKKNKQPHGYANHFDHWYERDVADWMRRDRNHACVVAWSLGNEVPEQFMGNAGAEVLKKLISTAMLHDQSRLFTAGCNGIPNINGSEFGQLIDLVGYNYHEALYAEDHVKFPERIIFGSETVIYPYQPGDCFQMHTYQEWLAGQTNEYVAGEFLWTGFDYLGEAGIGDGGTGCNPWNEWEGWPTRGATCGLLDICGFPKPAYYFRKALWNKEPMVYIAVQTDPSARKREVCAFWGWPKVQSHWNHNKEGDTLAVHVYTNVPDVELFVNGESKGKKHWEIQNEAFLMWEVPYKSGSIEAIGTLPSGEKVTYKIQTAGEPAKIKLLTDKTTLLANSSDASYVEVQVLDANNNLVPFADNLIEFEVSGAGILKAVGNGNQDSHTPFKGNKMETYHGKCLAIVQSENEKGKLTLTAKCEGIPVSTIDIQVE